MNEEWHIFPLIIVHLRDSVITGRLQGHQSLQASVVLYAPGSGNHY